MSEILEYLRKMQTELRAKDPLIQRGIMEDWVCVVHPAIEYKLRQKAIEGALRWFQFLLQKKWNRSARYALIWNGRVMD